MLFPALPTTYHRDNLHQGRNICFAKAWYIEAAQKTFTE